MVFPFDRRYLNVRALAAQLEPSLKSGIKFSAFEPQGDVPREERYLSLIGENVGGPPRESHMTNPDGRRADAGGGAGNGGEGKPANNGSTSFTFVPDQIENVTFASGASVSGRQVLDNIVASGGNSWIFTALSPQGDTPSGTSFASSTDGVYAVVETISVDGTYDAYAGSQEGQISVLQLPKVDDVVAA